tara:strand:+ start:526 stop:768 length:243 start_codon:yes stop_codon:yes gene_type:complete
MKTVKQIQERKLKIEGRKIKDDAQIQMMSELASFCIQNRISVADAIENPKALEALMVWDGTVSEETISMLDGFLQELGNL